MSVRHNRLNIVSVCITDLVLYRFWKIDLVFPRNLNLGKMDEAQCDAAATHACR